ncbi:hypothetical protein [Oceanicola sp. 502str15]|uniref:hypothetical protein n=1 Tax=Oceanicola sp. 502str15 TaxID=2696061 RepID=UPI002094A173|nr:hypothetical protein [Oceanicola sp. 502str15]MCO6385029.1 hypothetical protein [Oceanicola sp. 502str15]
MRFKTIEIDFEIHKMIEAVRKGFHEPEYVALRRLLALPEPSSDEAEDDDINREGIPFTEDGVEILHGSYARMRYLRGTQQYEGQFLDGKLVVEGVAYPTLSAAASDLARTKEGKKTSLNGWLYWEVKVPGTSRWIKLSDLRDQVNAKLKQASKWV